MVIVTWNTAFANQFNLGLEQSEKARTEVLKLVTWSAEPSRPDSVKELVSLIVSAFCNCPSLGLKYWVSLAGRLVRPQFLKCYEPLFRYTSSGRVRRENSEIARELFLAVYNEVMVAAGSKGPFQILGVSLGNPITPEQKAHNLKIVGPTAARHYRPVREFLLQPRQLDTLSRLLKSKRESDTAFAVRLLYRLIDDRTNIQTVDRFLRQQFRSKRVDETAKDELKKSLAYAKELFGESAV